MIPIMPDGEVKILEDIPLDNSYANTITFQNALSQASYFRLNAKLTFDNVSYMRASGGSIKIQAKIEDVYNCNYMMFKNSNYENKWFYAFILGAEYVNNITTQIWFEIDVMQTWMFDYTLKECFVEREHPVTDNIGDNLIPEDLETGDYVTEGQHELPALSETAFVMWSSVDPKTLAISSGGQYCGLPCAIYPFATQNSMELQGWLNALDAAGRGDAVVAISVVPLVLLGGSTTVATDAQRINFTIPKSYGAFDGYTPKNKKLYTYPYNMLYVSGFNGNAATYPYEYFKTANNVPLDYCPFILTGDITPQGSIAIWPNKYKGTGLGADNTVNYDEKLLIGTNAMLPWACNAYANWLAQNVTSLALNTISQVKSAEIARKQAHTAGYYGTMGGVISAGANYLGGDYVGALQSSMGAGQSFWNAHFAKKQAKLQRDTAIAQALATVYEHSIQPPQAKGAWGNSYLLAYGLLGGWYCRKRIRGEFARIIDNYFDMYGYATHALKVPNTDSRPHWNYVRTQLCNLTGNLPQAAIDEIKSVYDSGITFWKNPGEIGNYSLDNSPT